MKSSSPNINDDMHQSGIFAIEDFLPSNMKVSKSASPLKHIDIKREVYAGVPAAEVAAEVVKRRTTAVRRTAAGGDCNSLLSGSRISQGNFPADLGYHDSLLWLRCFLKRKLPVAVISVEDYNAEPSDLEKKKEKKPLILRLKNYYNAHLDMFAYVEVGPLYYFFRKDEAHYSTGWGKAFEKIYKGTSKWGGKYKDVVKQIAMALLLGFPAKYIFAHARNKLDRYNREAPGVLRATRKFMMKIGRLPDDDLAIESLDAWQEILRMPEDDEEEESEMLDRDREKALSDL